MGKNRSIKDRFLFVDIVSILFQIILFVGNFLGLLYLFEGNVPFSIAGSLLLTVLYFFLIQLLVDSKELMFKNKFKHATSLFWLFYLGLAIVSGFLLSHFINIEFNVKSEIQKSAYQKLAVVSNSVEKFDDLSKGVIVDYENEVKEKLEKYKEQNNQDQLIELTRPPYNFDKNSLINVDNINVSKLVNAHLTPIYEKIENNLKYLKSSVKKTNLNYESVFKNWKRLDLMQTYSNLNGYVDKSVQAINKMIEGLPLKAALITPKYDKSALPLSSPSALNKKYKPSYTLPVVVILIIHFFLILPFYTKEVRTYVKTKPRTPKRDNTEDNMRKGNENEPKNRPAGGGNSGGTIEL